MAPDAEGRLARLTEETWIWHKTREMEPTVGPLTIPPGARLREPSRSGCATPLEMVNPRPVIVFQQVIPWSAAKVHA